MSALRVGIIGTGLAANSHAFDILSSDDLELAAVCSRRPERAVSFAARFGAEHVFASVEEMLRSGACEAVVVAVPPQVVLEISRAVLGYGYPALVEKPVATSTQALDKLAALAEASGAPAVVCFNRRYQRHVRAAVEAVRAGTIGSVRRFAARWVGPYASRYAADAPTYRSQARNRHGLLPDTGSHILDLLVWALDTPLTVENCVLNRNERGADVGFTVTLRLGTQVRACIRASDEANQRTEQRRVEFEADHGAIVVGDDGTAITTSDRTEWIPAEETHRPVDDLVALHHGEPVLGATLHDALRISRLLVEAYDCAGASGVKRWGRPRFKPWGRLNGSC
ncbi:hypothetical protein TH66_11035 [Carbonactinospora thermoautotrophica]|uniref:Putative oxidoreductase n=1 Tax=Carbonactinospora thermoautotrophica TaxID=1469144 RepID=A0A132N8Y4_9ACTN|nr:Gfo/Idh/MocA family oxidoreductase [Carbonactinospora thermoautotrophica]KWX02266.1 putative oxidoreductase [Carbonactinospora thermoautotrophica]KWX03438.1 hypothetical protein TH66_11035 [Carbonactinospora thermoautotrophica]KWX06564.1 hypothetical protein TR74_21670 [Carbonactinospora thermoautotrophica]